MQQSSIIPIKDKTTKSKEFGKILKKIFDTGYDGVPGYVCIDELISLNDNISYDEIMGAFTLMSILGLIAIDSNDIVRTTSKYARFSIGSIAEFLLHEIPIAKEGDVNEEEQKYYTAITSAMELMRRSKINSTPIYSVEIVNVIIKGKQIRNWKEVDVFLHVYHPKWKAYHLIGIGKRNANETIDDLAIKSMKIKLDLDSHQFELDSTINPLLQNPLHAAQ